MTAIPSLHFHNRFVEQPNSARPGGVVSCIQSGQGTHMIVRERRAYAPSAPRILDTDEVALKAIERVQAAEVAARAGAKLEPKRFKESWQRRQVRKENLRDFDMWTMGVGHIGKNKHEVAHPFLIDQRRAQRARWKKFGESTELRNGEVSLKLSHLMTRQIEARKAELYALVKGIQTVAESDGLVWGMLTLTAPARFHPAPARGRSSWDGSTPHDAHMYLHDRWRAVLRRLSNLDISISGLRVTEYHKDGCPHWHVIFYCEPDHLNDLVNETRKEWDEVGADFVMGDDEKGSFASYCVPYVIQTLGTPEHGGDAERYDVKRSVWSQRACQFFGVPSRSLWRALRALPECPEGDLEAATWRAARRGDGAAFIGFCGGLAVSNKLRPIRGKIESTPAPFQHKAIKIEAVDFKTGEVRLTAFELPTWKKFRLGLAVIDNYPRESKAPNPPPPPNNEM